MSSDVKTNWLTHISVGKPVVPHPGYKEYALTFGSDLDVPVVRLRNVEVCVSLFTLGQSSADEQKSPTQYRMKIRLCASSDASQLEIFNKANVHVQQLVGCEKMIPAVRIPEEDSEFKRGYDTEATVVCHVEDSELINKMKDCLNRWMYAHSVYVKLTKVVTGGLRGGILVKVVDKVVAHRLETSRFDPNPFDVVAPPPVVVDSKASDTI